MLEELFEIHLETAKAVDASFRRYLYKEIDFRSRLIGVIGARGVGKTTLLLQYYKEHFDSPEKCLYISADNIRVAALGLFEIAREFFRLDGKVLIIDEIHKYKNWSQELKNIYDSFPKGRLIISGSSLLDILKGKGDLSRRIVFYPLKGLSFREYLILQTNEDYSPFPLTDLLKKHIPLASKISSSTAILKHFKSYLKNGYYPFYLEGIDQYLLKLENVIEKIIYEDIPSTYEVRPSSIPLLKKIIYLVATSQPFTPNIEKISSQLSVSKEYIYHFLDYLERAGLFAFLYPRVQGLKLARKPEKIYLENPNLIYAITGKHGFRSEIGAVRESFFMNQVRYRHAVFWTDSGDFDVEGKFVVEVGGRKKEIGQLRKKHEAYVAADDIEVGSKDKIPLWLFGFLY